jgi:hypothetical protein
MDPAGKHQDFVNIRAGRAFRIEGPAIHPDGPGPGAGSVRMTQMTVDHHLHCGTKGAAFSHQEFCMALTITITDTVATASMGDGWADPAAVAATFAFRLEDAYFSAVTQLYPEATVQAAVNYQEETLGSDLEVVVDNPGSKEEFDCAAMAERVRAAIKDLKGQLGEEYLTSDEAEEEKEEKEVGDE